PRWLHVVNPLMMGFVQQSRLQINIKAKLYGKLRPDACFSQCLEQSARHLPAAPRASPNLTN
ncbi:hypothetical protein, partial [Thalassobacter stenotrophicus]|uniref:hypothetical protein n=1 Tax=Thalassobacter stenotrophicus TaxID=266809 RepID=UPI001F40A573